jgi:hypothetical protein
MPIDVLPKQDISMVPLGVNSKGWRKQQPSRLVCYSTLPAIEHVPAVPAATGFSAD